MSDDNKDEMMMGEENAMGMDDAMMGKPEDKKDDAKADDKKPLLGGVPDMGKMNPFGGDDTGSDRTVTPWGREPTYEECCCCYCHCSDRETKDVTCCGCFPIRCGVVVIGILVSCFTLYMFCATFFLIMNEYIKWWFPFVSLILMTPAIIGTCFFLGWFTKDCKRTRGNLTSAIVLHLISWSLVICW
jgi:hypothetical protein